MYGIRASEICGSRLRFRSFGQLHHPLPCPSTGNNFTPTTPNAGGGRSAAAAGDLPGGLLAPFAGGFRSGGAIGSERKGRRFRAAALRPDWSVETVLPADRGRILARDGSAAGLRSSRRGRGGRLSLAARAGGLGLAAGPCPRAAAQGRPQRRRGGWPRPGPRCCRSAGNWPSGWPALCGLSSDAVAIASAAHPGPRGTDCRGRQPSSPVGSRRAAAGRRIVDRGLLRLLLGRLPPPPRIIVAEELAHHVVADDVPAAVVSEMRSHPERYPGTKIVGLTRRTYPQGSLAAHVLGHLGEAEGQTVAAADDPAGRNACPDVVGRTGMERQYEALLRGRPGVAVEQTRPRRPHCGIILPASSRLVGARPAADARHTVAAHGRGSACQTPSKATGHRRQRRSGARPAGQSPSWMSAAGRSACRRLGADVRPQSVCRDEDSGQWPPC